MIVKFVAKNVLDASSGIAENGGPSNDVFDFEPDEDADGNSSAKATLSMGLAESGDENASNDTAAHCVPSG